MLIVEFYRPLVDKGVTWAKIMLVTGLLLQTEAHLSYNNPKVSEQLILHSHSTTKQKARKSMKDKEQEEQRNAFCSANQRSL